MSRRLTARVRGVVQGVGFRAFVIQKARRLALTGWVRNREDGSVEAVAEGPDARLRELEQALRRGLYGARVDFVDAVYEDATGEFGGFNVRY